MATDQRGILSRHKVGIMLLLLTAIAVILAIAYSTWQQRTNEWQAIYARTATYCMELYQAVDDPATSDSCPQWAQYMLETSYDTLLACYRQAPDLDEAFNRCLDGEGILTGRPLSQET
jgi:hypothetical protein